MSYSTNHQNVRLQSFILLLGAGLMGLKFLTWFLTHSNTILTDALESIVNVLAGAFALFALWLAAKPKDEEHPYGHGKIEFVSAGFEGALILLAGLGIMVKSSYNLIHPGDLHDVDLGIWLSLISGGLNYIFGWVLEARGNKTRSLAMIASGQHLKSDGYTSAAMIVGLVVIYFTELKWLDSVIAIAMGGLIVFMGFRLVRRSLAGIMDEADREVIVEILGILNKNRKSEWIDVHNLRVIKYGTTFHVDCHVTLPYYYNLQQAHDTLDNMSAIIEKEASGDVEFFIHTDPCIEKSCTICGIADCAVRKQPQKQTIHWTYESLVTNAKHGLV